MQIRFGTEGWRAVMAEEFTGENVRRVTQAIADHFLAASRLPTKRQGAARTRRPVRMAVGYDTRFLSEHFARTVCEVLVGNGIRVDLSPAPIPTCAVSRHVIACRSAAGIMVTASHNPAIYNGLKVKETYGGSATTGTVESIERRLGRSRVKRVPFGGALEDGRIRLTPMMSRFLQGIRSFIDVRAIRRAPLRVIADPMHGAAGGMIEHLLAGGACRVKTIHQRADPLFGGQSPEPIASHLTELSRVVRQSRADIGIANDGDADRVGIIAPGGSWLNPGQILCLLLRHLVETRGLGGAVVKTVSNTMMINRMAESLGLRLLEVPVGFKYIAQLMLEDDILIGGEESGGIGVKGYLPERDGIVNGLLVLEAMAARRQKLSTMIQDLERRYGRWFYGRCDLALTRSQVDGLFHRLVRRPPSRMAGISVERIDQLDGVKLIGRDGSWLLFRRSGTEPVVRVYAETPARSRLPRLLDLGVRWVKPSTLR